jgi:hypothetical protein
MFKGSIVTGLDCAGSDSVGPDHTCTQCFGSRSDRIRCFSLSRSKIMYLDPDLDLDPKFVLFTQCL